MKDIRLQRLSLKNFKGIASLDFAPGGEDASIYGDNATGKTTLVDAFMWLLFGKDSLNQASFEIKPLDPSGEPAHGIEHGVAAQLNISGKVLTLRKVLSEKWTKKRGSAAKEFTGHTTDYFVDGVPKPKKDFDAAVSSLCDEQLFRLLTNPRYFNEVMHWQKRRELLLEVCGNVTDAQVIESDPALSPLAISDRSMDDQRKVLTARRAEINKELDKIPVRIDECKQLAEQVPEGKASELDLADLHNLLTVKQNELARIESGGEVAEKTKALREIEAQILAIETGWKEQHHKKQEELLKRKAAVTTQLPSLQAEAYGLDNRIKAIEARLEALRKQWIETDSATPAVKDACPTCGQALPAEQVEQAIKTHNEQKARNLAAINTEGRAAKQELTELQSKREASLQSAAELAAQIELMDAEIKAHEYKPVETPEYLNLIAGKELLTHSIRELGNDSTAAVIEAQAEIDRLRAEIDKQVAYREQERAAKHARQRIDALKSEERTLAGEYERIEQELALLDKFTRAKVGMLEGKINSRFALAKFKLFQEQINGGVTECCEVVVNGVPYSSLNNAMRINVGLDIINTLSEHYKSSVTVWIDNAEAITQLMRSNAQQIRLVVSEQDKQLRIETKQAAKAA